MKKVLMLIFVALYIININPHYVFAESNVWKEFYVSTTGCDENLGTKDAPFKTIQKAKDAVRLVSAEMKGHIVINITEGYYFLDDILDFTNDDSGKNGFNIIYRGNKNNMPVISAGRKIEGFVPSSEYEGLYETYVDDLEHIRELYINEEVRYLSKSAGMIKGVKKPQKYDTIEWYSQHPNAPAGDSYNFYDPNTSYAYDGLYISKEDFGFYENVKDIEFCWDIRWVSRIMHISSIEENPDDDSNLIVRMEPGLWNYLRILNTNNNAPSGEINFYIRNAMELLDSPGEFYFNRRTKMLYYMPFSNEDMSTANVVAPKLDTIAIFTGNDVDDKVKNITFEGLKFAHNSCYLLSDSSVGVSQGLRLSTSAGAKVVSGAFKLRKTENINFYDNYFFGLSTAAFDLVTSVEKSNIRGNAFSDIGGPAVIVGRGNNRDDFMENVNPLPNNLLAELYLTNVVDSTVAASYFGDTNNNITVLMGGSGYHFSSQNTTYITDYTKREEYKSKPWKSDPHAPERGEKSWIIYDFQRPYSINKVDLLFSSGSISDIEKSNYEILLSNDRYFKDYEVVGTQITPSKTVASYLINKSGKYRYMMIRTIGATPLALNYAYAYTSDDKPYKMYERCKNISIENNYIERPSAYWTNGGGIFVYYAENIDILNNEITNCPYSGIQIGWGWQNFYYGSYYYNVSYNKIDNVNRLIYDGGGIYSLGRCVGTIVSNNYITRMNTAHGGLYLDQGSSGMLWFNNAVGNTAKAMHINTTSVIENEVVNNFSSGSLISNTSRTGDNYVENLKLYTQGNPPKDVYSIMKNAGLTAPYLYLRNLVPKTRGSLMPDYYLGGRILTELADSILASNNFGSNFGQFAINYKYKLRNALSEYNDTNKTDTPAKAIALNNVVFEADSQLNRQSFADMLSLCKKIIADADISLYSLSSLQAFGETVARVEAAVEEGYNMYKEYELLIILEEAYNLLENQSYNNDIDYAYVEDAKDVRIDKINKNITVVLPFYKELGTKKIELWPHGGSQIADAVSSVDLRTETTIPVFCPSNGQYSYWTIKGVTETVESSSGNISPVDWFTHSSDEYSILSLQNGDAMLTASPYAFMGKTHSSNGATVKFVPLTRTSINNLSVILGAQDYEEFDIKDRSAKCNRYQIDFENQTAKLYYVNQGTKTLIKVTDANLNYNSQNTLSCQFSTIGLNTNIKVSINGAEIFNEIGALNLGYYMGFYSPKMNIKILQ